MIPAKYPLIGFLLVMSCAMAWGGERPSYFVGDCEYDANPTGLYQVEDRLKNLEERVSRLQRLADPSKHRRITIDGVEFYLVPVKPPKPAQRSAIMPKYTGDNLTPEEADEAYEAFLDGPPHLEG